MPPGSGTPAVRGDGQVNVTVVDDETTALTSIAAWSLTPGCSGTQESSKRAGIGDPSAWLYSVIRTTCGGAPALIANVAVVG